MTQKCNVCVCVWQMSPVSMDEGQRHGDEDRDRSATPSQPQLVPPAAASGAGPQEARDEDEEGERGGESDEVREWMGEDAPQGGEEDGAPPGSVNLEVSN